MSIFDNIFSRDKKGNEAKEPQKAPVSLPFPSKLLVVTDGSQLASRVVDFALALSSRIEGTHICVGFVIDEASMDLLQQMRIFVSEEREILERELEQKGRRTLEKVKEKAAAMDLEVDTFLMRGRISDTILKAAKELQADMIAVAGWKDGLRHKDTTSVERKIILDQADCPVVVIK